MIHAERFTYVHLPKTGGSFVTVALYRVHLIGAKYRQLQRLINAPRLTHRYVGKYGEFIYSKNKHGFCSEIPEQWRDRPILATIRNPYDRYVSQYEFGWWRKRAYRPFYHRIPDFEKRFPSFPDLSFAEFLELINDGLRQPKPHRWQEDDGFGNQTEEFVKFFCREPDKILAQLRADPATFKLSRNDLFPIDFIHTDNLNRELHDYLIERGYDRDDVSFILDLAKVLPGGKGRGDKKPWADYYTPALKRKVREKARVIFELFPEFDD